MPEFLDWILARLTFCSNSFILWIDTGIHVCLRLLNESFKDAHVNSFRNSCVKSYVSDVADLQRAGQWLSPPLFLAKRTATRCSTLQCTATYCSTMQHPAALLWCNNGGRGGIFSKVKRLVWKCIGTRKWIFSGFLVSHVEFWKGRNFSAEIVSPIKPRMHICPCLWAVGISKKIWIQSYFEPVTVDSVEIFHHFAFWRHGSKLAIFLIVPKNCIFWGASFKLIKNLATLDPEKF